jgi:polysaccharide biosynthesis transport protein
VTEADEAPAISLSQVRGIITRGRWWILLGMCTSVAAAIVYAYHLPVRFTSEAILLVVQQQVPQRYVTPTSTLGIADELQAMTQEVLSSKRLLDLIKQFGLYAKERQDLAPEEIIALMRKYINIVPMEAAPGSKSRDTDFNSFKISFSADKPILAQEVTSQLTSLFIQENLKVREEQAATTTNFLREQLEAAKIKLAQQEERQRDFKMQYLGELPEQQQGNVAILTSTQAQLQNTAASLDRAQQQRVYLESLLSGYRRLAVRGVAAPGLSSPAETTRINDPIQVLQDDLNQLQASRTKLLGVYSDRYPGVIVLDREIAEKQALLKRYMAAKTAVAVPPQGSPATTTSTDGGKKNSPVVQESASPQESEDATSIAQVKSQLEANRLEIQNLSKDEKQLKEAISQYQSRLNVTPIREQQLAGILRDYELSKQEYLDLLGKEQQSQLAMSLEKRQGGQQFRLAESASLPTLPSTPKRLKITLGGAGGGILFGLGLAVLAEIKNPKLYDEKEVKLRFSMPLVVGLPLLLSPAENRLRTCMRVFECSVGCVITIAVLAAEYYVYRHP